MFEPLDCRVVNGTIQLGCTDAYRLGQEIAFYIVLVGAVIAALVVMLALVRMLKRG